MKINRLKTFDSSLGVLLLGLIMPMSILANAETADGDFCQAPDALHEQINVSDATSSLENLRDLKAITKHGQLRVLLQKKINTCSISQTERQLIQEFAYINDLDLYWIYVDNNWQLLPELINGKGDIIVAQDQSLSASIQDQINFTHAWTNASYKIVERSDNSRLNRIEDLSGRRVAVFKSSPVWNKLLELAESQTGLVLQEIPPSFSYQEVMELVKTGQ